MLDDDDVTVDENDDDNTHKLQSQKVTTPHWRFSNKSMGCSLVILPMKFYSFTLSHFQHRLHHHWRLRKLWTWSKEEATEAIEETIEATEETTGDHGGCRGGHSCNCRSGDGLGKGPRAHQVQEQILQQLRLVGYAGRCSQGM